MNTIDRTTILTITKFWTDRIPQYTPKPHIFLSWLKTWRLEAIKQAIRETKRWIARTHDIVIDEDTDTNSIQAYFITTVNAIDDDMDELEQMAVPCE